MYINIKKENHLFVTSDNYPCYNNLVHRYLNQEKHIYVHLKVKKRKGQIRVTIDI